MLEYNELAGKRILIVGATGLFGEALVDFLVSINDQMGLKIQIFACSRSLDVQKENFSKFIDEKKIHFIAHDINNKIDFNIEFDYIVHAASNTHPNLYVSDPIGTITTNVFGTYNILEYMKQYPKCRLLFISSVEVYGKSLDGESRFRETDFGYIDCNTLRAGYPESKRLSESLCQAYIMNTNADIVIMRLSRAYGSTVRQDDSKALSQFIKKALDGEDIILKSSGTQRFSYCYIEDAVMAALYILLYGVCGEAYNVSADCDISLKEIAKMVAKIAGKSVIFDIPNATEVKGFSTADVALLDCAKIRNLGWVPEYTLEKGLEKTMRALRRNK